MARLVFLDSGPLGLISQSRARPDALLCKQWARDLLSAGVRIFIPEIADYEIRRELLRIGAPAGLQRLGLLRTWLEFSPITSDAMIQAAEFWADARRHGRPTASPDALDVDCIIAAQAHLAAGPGDVVTVATGNVGHLGQFVDARAWQTIS